MHITATIAATETESAPPAQGETKKEDKLVLVKKHSISTKVRVGCHRCSGIRSIVSIDLMSLSTKFGFDIVTATAQPQ